MQIRITKVRLAMAGLFVLAGIGAGSLLGPLITRASATAGQLVNVSDPTAPNTARVDSTGALKTSSSVTGAVGPALPRMPFQIGKQLTLSGSEKPVVGPTTATVAVTDLTVMNPILNTDVRALYVYRVTAPAPNTDCAHTDGMQLVGQYAVPVRNTVHVNLETPIVLKPPSGDASCLIVLIRALSSNSSPAGLDVTVGGYVPSGTYSVP